MIALYAHHQGHGHVHRAVGLAEALEARGHEAVVLSSAPRPAGCTVEWVALPYDVHAPAEVGAADPAAYAAPTAAGRLHWAPYGVAGLRSRMGRLSAFIEERRPSAMVVDVSVEIAVFTRLHGVPVVSVVLPGRRRDDAHELAFDVSSALVGFWPAGIYPTPTRLVGRLRSRVTPVGAWSRFPVLAPAAAPLVGMSASGGIRAAPKVIDSEVTPLRRELVVLQGSGGAPWTEAELDRLARRLPRWRCEVLQDAPADLVQRRLRGAAVVVTHAGEAAVAEVAACRVPAIVVPRPRPFDEQRMSARTLAASDCPVTVVGGLRAVDGEVVERTARLSGEGWDTWVDGGAADRFVDVVEKVVARSAAPRGGPCALPS